MTFEQAKQELVKAGYKVSAGSWKDHDSDWFVFSQEGAGPDSYGSPMARIRNDNGRITKDIPKHPGTNYKWSVSLRDRIALAAVKRELGFRDGAQELLAGLFSDYRKGANVEAEILRVAKRFGLIDYATNMLKKIDDQKSAEWEKSNKTYHEKEGRN
jgi:hypothetical protein